MQKSTVLIDEKELVYSRSSRSSLSTKLKLYVCILPIMLYGSECWALSIVDARKVDALDQ